MTATVVIAVVWLALERQRVGRQKAIVPELNRAGVQVLLAEPTALGQLVRKFLPDSEPRVAAVIGEGWFARPTVFVSSDLADARVASVGESLGRLGTVREVHLREPRLSPAGLAELKSELAGVGVVAADDRAAQAYYRAKTERPQFALGGAMLASLAAVGVPAVAVWAGWRLVRRRVSRGDFT